jgi:hypothetical protein
VLLYLCGVLLSVQQMLASEYEMPQHYALEGAILLAVAMTRLQSSSGQFAQHQLLWYALWAGPLAAALSLHGS